MAKTMKPYFVILNHPNGSVMPMVDEDENLAMYESETEAQVAACNSFLGDSCGFEIFELGGGTYHG